MSHGHKSILCRFNKLSTFFKCMMKFSKFSGHSLISRYVFKVSDFKPGHLCHNDSWILPKRNVNHISLYDQLQHLRYLNIWDKEWYTAYLSWKNEWYQQGEFDWFLSNFSDNLQIWGEVFPVALIFYWHHWGQQKQFFGKFLYSHIWHASPGKNKQKCKAMYAQVLI